MQSTIICELLTYKYELSFRTIDTTTTYYTNPHFDTKFILIFRMDVNEKTNWNDISFSLFLSSFDFRMLTGEKIVFFSLLKFLRVDMLQKKQNNMNQ